VIIGSAIAWHGTFHETQRRSCPTRITETDSTGGGFRDLYYPDSRRHNLEAIVAYGPYKRSPHAGSPANEAAYLNGDPISTEVVSLDGWEDGGGASL
jgi:hypothetical protein